MRWLVLLVLMVLATGVNAQDGADTPTISMFRGDVERTGRFVSPPLRSEPSRLWQFDLPEPNRTTIAVAHGLAFTGSEAGALVALDAATGAEVWSFQTGNTIVSTPFVDADGALYFGSADRSVYRLDAQTGELVWSFQTGDEVFSSPVVQDGVVYIGSRDGVLYMLDSGTGAVVNSYRVGGEIWSSPALDAERVYVGSRNGRVAAVNRATGELVWRANLRGGVDATPALDLETGLMFVGDYDGDFHAIRMADGEIVWQTTFADAVYASAAIGNSMVVVNDFLGTLVAYEKETGAELWRADIGRIAYSSPSISVDPVSGDETVYALSEQGGLMYAFDGTTGAELWRVQTGEEGDWRSSTPVIINGILYIGSNTDGVIAFG